MDILIIGMIVFLLCAFGARMISERALRELPSEQKVLLLDAFAGWRAYGLLPVVVLVGAMLLFPKLFPDRAHVGIWLAIGLAVVYILVRQVLVMRKLRALPVDPTYKRKQALARLVQNIGLLVLVATVVIGMMAV
ncbi:MAG: hypothetical protein H6597_04400 [Flavobacteriales bacterium]|nr:hypothetical protein [Flavobacteriales bacterium]